VELLDALGVVAALAAAVAAHLRWLRVAQREHYLTGSATRFALRWWGGLGPNRLLAAATLAGVVMSAVAPFAGLASALAIAIGPFGLRLRGNAPGPLVWTRRLGTLAGTVAGLTAVLTVAGGLVGLALPAALCAAVLSPVLVDLGCALLAPLEDRLASRFVDAAQARLREVAPKIVAITGSYGKTTAKAYVAHLAGGTKTVVPSPASFNNRAGLSRAINEGLAPGTEVFVAEMGAYRPGEIAELCSWFPPDIAAIAAIGPVHLERFGSLDMIVAAKSEILERAPVVVLNIDDPRLAALADREADAGKRVWRCSGAAAGAPGWGAGFDVWARPGPDRCLTVTAIGDVLFTGSAAGATATNVALAVAIALELGVTRESVASRLSTLPEVASRRALTPLSTGATAIDDTFNSNPAGAAEALAMLRQWATSGHKRVVVTPGMMELGPVQAMENKAFAAAAAAAASELLVVGHTNRSDLLAGAARGRAESSNDCRVLTVATRAEAVEWVRANTGPGDVVLYENDLPDHYP